MKFTILSVVSLFAFATVSALPAEDVVGAPRPDKAQCGSRHRASPFYRSYNGRVGDHFYTPSEQEAVNAVKLGYAREGIAGYLFNSKEPGTVPFYRLYSAGGTDHFYTSSAPERDNAVNHLGYTYEATYYLYPTYKCGAVPFYRLYSGKAVDHFYTTSARERDSAKGSGYNYEGIAGYLYPK